MTAPGAAPAAAGGAGSGTVTEIALSGVDQAVLGKARAGRVALAAGDRVVVARTIKLAKPADLVAVSADDGFPAGAVVTVRVKEKGKWGAWTELEADGDHAPDAGSVGAATARAGSAPLLTAGATAVQLRIDTPQGVKPKGLSLSVADIPARAADSRLGTGRVGTGRVSASSATLGMPTIITRAQWGADESWRRRAPSYTGAIKVGFVHHTASTTNYTPDEAAKYMRAIYAYHTKSLKHSDIDYNFLVDRYGRLFEGRYGGVDRPVEGGHTAGFNSNSFAVSALGDFQKVNTPVAEMSAMKDAIARLFAWKLGMYGINPAGMVDVVAGSFYKKIRFAAGSVAHIPAMSSHQTVNYTDCPGKYLQAQMPSIRALAATYQNLTLAPPVPEVPQFVAGSRASIPIVSQATKTLAYRLDILSPCSDTPIRSISGQADVAGPISLSWDLLDANGQPVLPATYTLRMSGAAADGTPVADVANLLTIAPAPGGAWGPCANVTRMLSDSATTSVLYGSQIFPGPVATAVLTGDGATASGLAAGLAAAPLAHLVGGPLLLNPAGALAAPVRADLIARGVREVLVVGGADVVSDAAAAEISALGITVTRLAGATPADTAGAVAARFGVPGSAVLVDPAAPGHALAGAALAAARNHPVLLASAAGLPVATSTALAALGAVNVTVAAAPESIPDAVLAGLSASRLAGTDAATGSATIAGAFPAQAATASLIVDSAASWVPAAAVAATGRPLLVSAASTLSPSVQAYFTGRTGLSAVTAAALSADLDDSILGGVSRLLLGLPWSAPSVPPVAPPTKVTPTVSATATATRKVKAANASPEPVRKGAPVTVRAKVTAKYTDKKWRAAPAGVAFKLQFRKSGARKWKTVGTGATTGGLATGSATATKSGRWRIVVGKKASASDYVKVRK